MNLKIKLITGFRPDQSITIDAEEAHKAYFLFFHPDKRGIFNNGVALIGTDIRQVVPNFQATMGWNETHQLDSDDWNEIRAAGIDRQLRDILYEAKQIAQLGKLELINLPLSEAKTKLLENG